MESLGTTLPQEQARVQELLTEYKALGPVGSFGAMMIEASLQNADKAVMSGDVVEMIRAYNDLKGCQ